MAPRFPNNLWFKHCPEEVEIFYSLMAKCWRWRFWHPNYAAAPWHLQAQLLRGQGPVVNLWPHTYRHQVEAPYCKPNVAETFDEIEAAFPLPTYL